MDISRAGSSLVADYILRFIVGGLAVSAFAVLGDIFRPKTFAGLFSAAPSIAIATLMITLWRQGAGYAAIEGRSMIIGGASFCVYCLIVCYLMKRHRLRASFSTALASAAWLACALGLTWLFLG